MMNPLELLIHAEIGSAGPMSFTRFMELALYHPEHGYYAREQDRPRTGKEGDFVTSVSAGPLFGRLLALQFGSWWKHEGKPPSFDVVEAGANDGQLASDLLKSIRSELPEMEAALRYTIVEPLPRLREKQRKLLGEFSCVKWVGAIEELGKLSGVIFGNELVDAFPVHRLCWEGNDWSELKIVSLNQKLGWSRVDVSKELKADLPMQGRGGVEVCPSGLGWIQSAAGALEKGRIVLFDYGWTDPEYFQVERPEGTLRGYKAHRYVDDVLVEPGECDLTAHVRWTPLLEHATRSGLRQEEFLQQSRWLTRVFAEHLPELTSSETRQFQTLAHPGMLGEAFRVLVLQK